MAFNPGESERINQARQAQHEQAKEGFEVSCPITDCGRCVRVPVERIVSVEMVEGEAAVVNATAAKPSDCNNSDCATQMWGAVAIDQFDIRWLYERVPAERISDS
jgi:hypothetical protein